MNINKMKEILDILKGIDINEVGFIAEGDENHVRGISSDRSTLVYSSTESIVEHSMGIVSVKSLLSRLSLFDEEKMGVELVTRKNDKGTHVSEILIKEGRRKSKVSTNDPQLLGIPTEYPPVVDVFAMSMTKDYIDYLNKMKGSIGSTFSVDQMYVELGFNPTSEENEIELSINGDYDNYVDKLTGIIEEDYIGQEFSVQWNIDSFMKTMKKAASVNTDEVIMFTVKNIGILEVSVGDIIVSVVPINVTNSD